MAVPRCGVSRLIEAMTASLSVVGACTRNALSLNETTPILTPFRCFSMKERAATLAASRRVGLRSSARMLPDTSIVRITVPSSFGSVTTDMGRASAISMNVRPTRNSAGGRCRRQPGPRPNASFTSDRLAYRSA